MAAALLQHQKPEQDGKSPATGWMTAAAVGGAMRERLAPGGTADAAAPKTSVPAVETWLRWVQPQMAEAASLGWVAASRDWVAASRDWVQPRAKQQA